MTTETTEGTIAKEKIVQDFKTVYSDVEELNRVRTILKQNGVDAALVKVREAEK